MFLSCSNNDEVMYRKLEDGIEIKSFSISDFSSGKIVFSIEDDFWLDMKERPIRGELIFQTYKTRDHLSVDVLFDSVYIDQSNDLIINMKNNYNFVNENIDPLLAPDSRRKNDSLKNFIFNDIALKKDSISSIFLIASTDVPTFVIIKDSYRLCNLILYRWTRGKKTSYPKQEFYVIDNDK